MAGQGKFDALTKELINHFLGFQEGEENFVRSEQFVLSNLLYHHCLAVNSHAIRRSLDGLALKFTIHGQHKRTQQLTDLTSRYLASPVHKDHLKLGTDVEWSLLSLLLHLSNSPTQVPLVDDPDPLCPTRDTPLLSQGQAIREEEEEDWAAFLRDEEDQYHVGPEEPLSDWSSDEESGGQVRIEAASTQPHKTPHFQSQESCIHPTLPPKPFTQPSRLPMQPPNPFTLHLDSQDLKLEPTTLTTDAHDKANPHKEPNCLEHAKNLLSTVNEPPKQQQSLPRHPHGFPTHPPSLPTHSLNLPPHPQNFPKKPQAPLVSTTQEKLEQLHRAKSWLSAKTQLQYWGPKCPSQLSVSDHPAANVAKLWEMDQGLRPGWSQQLGEWSVMREIVWSLSCPSPSHVFTRDAQGNFSLRDNLTLPSLTPGATKKLLSSLCKPLNQLHTLDIFIRSHQSFSHPSSSAASSPPITFMAYATGLGCWRQRFLLHLVRLEERIKEQELTCTLLWLEGELHPWLHTLASIYSVHHTGLAAPPESSPGYIAVRLLGTLCEGVNSAGDDGVRVVLVRLLLHSIRHYLSLIHTWLFHGSLHDQTTEFVVTRNESVEVKDENFWHEAFTLSLHQQDYTSDSKDPAKTMMKLLSPLLATLISVGKSRELLAILEVPTDPGNSCFFYQDHVSQEMEKSLEETVVWYVQEALSRHSKESHMENKASSNDNTDVTNAHESEKQSESVKENEGKKKDEREEKEKRNVRRKNELVITPIRDQTDPLLWAAFTETEQNSSTSLEYHEIDTVTRLIESISEAPRAVSSVSLLSSALRPLLTATQERLNTKLTRLLLDQYNLETHCQAVRAVLLMEAGDIMHEFYSHLFAKVDAGESVDATSLTLHLQYCVSRLHPHLAHHFSVMLPQGGEAAPEEETLSTKDDDHTEALLIEEVGGSGKEALRRMQESVRQPSEAPSEGLSGMSLTRAGLPELYIQYQAPWPSNLLLTEPTMKQLNQFFNFMLSLKRVTNGLERLKFRDLSGWHLTANEITSRVEDELENNTTSPLPSRLHRLQLLRHWLLCFSRELHNHFAYAVFLPYHRAVERLFSARPSLNTILTEHEKLLKKLLTECLMGTNEGVLPLQIVLNKVFELNRRLSEVWVSEAGGVGGSEVTRLETRYACLHRYLAHFLTIFVTTQFVPHMEGLTRALVDTVPLLTQNQ